MQAAGPCLRGEAHFNDVNLKQVLVDGKHTITQSTQTFSIVIETSCMVQIQIAYSITKFLGISGFGAVKAFACTMSCTIILISKGNQYQNSNFLTLVQYTPQGTPLIDSNLLHHIHIQHCSNSNYNDHPCMRLLSCILHCLLLCFSEFSHWPVPPFSLDNPLR